MVKMIHKHFGTVMLVAEERVEEYKAAGHKLAVSSDTKPVKEEPKSAPKKSAKKK